MFSEQKRFCEVRKDDRDYQAGDTIVYAYRMSNIGVPVFIPEKDRFHFKVTHVLRGTPGLGGNFVALSIILIKGPKANTPTAPLPKGKAKKNLTTKK